MPKQYDFVYLTIDDRMKFDNALERKFIKNFLQLVSNGGRLIFGLYESDNNIFKKLESFGFEFNGFLENSVTRVAWIDK